MNNKITVERLTNGYTITEGTAMPFAKAPDKIICNTAKDVADYLKKKFGGD